MHAVRPRVLGRVLACAVLCLGPSWTAPAHAQGNESTTSTAAAESPEEAGAVQIGAGSTAAVTTGSSGPESAANPTVTPLDPPFDIAPPRHAFLGPGMLPVAAPGRPRCGVIVDDTARRMCEARASATREGRR